MFCEAGCVSQRYTAPHLYHDNGGSGVALRGHTWCNTDYRRKSASAAAAAAVRDGDAAEAMREKTPPCLRLLPTHLLHSPVSRDYFITHTYQESIQPSLLPSSIRVPRSSRRGCKAWHCPEIDCGCRDKIMRVSVIR